MMMGLARVCVGRRNLVIVGWLVMLVGLAAGLGIAGSAFSDSTTLPSSDSATAYDLLGKAGSDAASAKSGTIVWSVKDGSALTGSVRADIDPMLTDVAAVDGVSTVVSPFTAATGATHVSNDGRTAYATVVFSDDKNAEHVIDVAKKADNSAVDVQTGGQAFTDQIPSEITEIIGVLAALLILLLVFRSMWAALLPIITGVAGVGVSALIVLLLSNVVTLPSVALSLGALIGLGVGIDYALFIVNRQRKALKSGATVEHATVASMNTSGRAVLFAGGTVVIALLGMLILNIGFLTGMAISAGVTVAMTVLAAVTLLPALLGKLGHKVLRRSERGSQPITLDAVAADTGVKDGLAARWSRLVQRHPLGSGAIALIVMLTLAAPVLVLRLGNADASSDPAGTDSRSYYNTMSAAFGDGFQSQLLLVAETPDAKANATWQGLIQQLRAIKGVASVGEPTRVGSSGTLSMVALTPATAAQAEATSDLVVTLRSTIIKDAESGTDLQVHVGGSTATAIDFAHALTSKLPLFLIIIAALGFLLLMIAFRSLLVPAVGALGNLLSIAVALGITVVTFQWGWGPSVFGVGGGAPVEYIVAILMVGVVFGLSMDYHVFLVSRMHEEWTHSHDNRRAIGIGMADTGKVIAAAAAIMACVFASFGFSGLRTTSEFGVGLAVAVLADAFLVRMTIVPAVMSLIGRHNWSIPNWLDRVLPHVSVEGSESEEVVDSSPPVYLPDTAAVKA